MLEKLFKIRERNSTISKEIMGGVITFLTMSYIIAVNPAIMSDHTGMNQMALISVTCLASMIGTLMAGLRANVPFAMAPGMGLNAMFTYTLVLSNGATWQEALGVVFISGFVFLILTLTGFRNKIVDAIPYGLRFAIGAGIGLFIAFIGMHKMGLIVSNPDTLVSAGKFHLYGKDGTTTPNIGLILSVIGLAITVVLEIKKVKGAILIGIILTTVLACYFDPAQIHPTQIVSMPPSIAPVLFKLDILGALKFSLMGAIFSFMFVDLFDSVGTIVACSYQAGLVDKEDKMPHIKNILEADAVATIVGACLGTSTTTTYIESSAGIAGGARTGFSSIITAGLFVVAMFFSPVISIIPMYATAPALIIIGAYMCKNLFRIDFEDFPIAISAFLTMVLMPLTYSISMGISYGFVSYVLLRAVSNDTKKISGILWFMAILSLANIIISQF